MKLEFVKFDVLEDCIAVVQFANPPVNAHRQEVLDEITWVFDTVSDRADLRVAILTGQGKVFCAGADIKERLGKESTAGDHWRRSRRARELITASWNVESP